MNLNYSSFFVGKYNAYPASIYWHSNNNNNLENSDKVVLPSDAFKTLVSKKIFGVDVIRKNPIVFEISNNSSLLPKKTHCTVIEFTAKTGCIYLPVWMMENLGLDFNGISSVKLKTVHLPKGKLVEVQAHKTEYLRNLTIPRSILEKTLSKYSCLTVGDTVRINDKDKIYKFDIIKVEPSIIQSTAPPAILIFETNIEVDFKQPIDYQSWQQKLDLDRNNNINNNNNNNDVLPNKQEKKQQNESVEDVNVENGLSYLQSYGKQPLLSSKNKEIKHCNTTPTHSCFANTNNKFVFHHSKHAKEDK